MPTSSLPDCKLLQRALVSFKARLSHRLDVCVYALNVFALKFSCAFSGHYDAFDQGISFFLPNMTWIREMP
jgi:hypothetical protein